MKKFLLPAIVFFSVFSAFAQHTHELAPIQEHEFKYKNWTFKDVQTSADVELRSAMKGKKLVMVLYFAPWCPNWAYEAPVAQKLYDKYKGNGFEIIGVSEYGSLEDVKANLKANNITFPVVSESFSRGDIDKTTHADYRKDTGDTRRWGSPMNVFIEPAAIKKDGDTLLTKASIVNGELIEGDAEIFIRQKLGLPAGETKPAATAQAKAPEVCDETPKTTTLKKP
jgi:thiol-disulfide isomerase/thioredoxin